MHCKPKVSHAAAALIALAESVNAGLPRLQLTTNDPSSNAFQTIQTWLSNGFVLTLCIILAAGLCCYVLRAFEVLYKDAYRKKAWLGLLRACIAGVIILSVCSIGVYLMFARYQPLIFLE